MCVVPRSVGKTGGVVIYFEEAGNLKLGGGLKRGTPKVLEGCKLKKAGSLKRGCCALWGHRISGGFFNKRRCCL